MEKRAVPYVMECIELLFVAYFEREKDVHCAENAFQLYEFVKNLEGRIYESLHVGGWKTMRGDRSYLQNTRIKIAGMMTEHDNYDSV